MTPAADGAPVVGRAGRSLGVRVDGLVRDVAPDPQGRVHPGQGGMSVAPGNLWNLPNHRRPRRLGGGSTGHDSDAVFSIEAQAVGLRGLALRVDTDDGSHALVEPSAVEPLEAYEGRLADTRPDWRHDEP